MPSFMPLTFRIATAARSRQRVQRLAISVQTGRNGEIVAKAVTPVCAVCSVRHLGEPSRFSDRSIRTEGSGKPGVDGGGKISE